MATLSLISTGVAGNDPTSEVSIQVGNINTNFQALNTEITAGPMSMTNVGTTVDAVAVSADSLTTGSIARFASNSSSSSTRALVEIVNDNTGATGTTPLLIQQDAPTSTNYFKIASLGGITLWAGNGTTANGNLSGTAGDILLNGGSNKPEYCTGTTNWTALV